MNDAKKLTEEELENLAYEIIRFCKDRNLWEGIKLFAAEKVTGYFMQERLWNCRNIKAAEPGEMKIMWKVVVLAVPGND